MVDNKSNAAYDLSLFAPSHIKEAPAKKTDKDPASFQVVKEKRLSKKQQQLQKKKNQKKFFKVAVICSVLLFGCGMNLQSRAEIAKLAIVIEQETVSLETAESESVRLATQIETIYSFAKVQDYIKVNGMQKTQSHQKFDFNASMPDKVTNYLGMPAG
jgi:lipopolysaccharide export LptBFGC system permease protein LptF